MNEVVSFPDRDDPSTTMSHPNEPNARRIRQIVTAHSQREGAGFIVRRPLPTAGLELLDPFLLIDEMGPVEHAPGKAIGAPDHPHRGFETVSYILAGEAEHEDSAGHAGRSDRATCSG